MDEFKVIFLDDDKKTILAEVQVEYGEKAVYPNETPTKDTIQGVKYYFIGWEGQEKLEVVTADTTVIAKYAAETDTKSNEQALYDASLQNAENTNYSVVAEAGQKAVSQEKAVEKEKVVHSYKKLDTYGVVSILIILGSLLISLGIIASIVMLGGI